MPLKIIIIILIIITIIIIIIITIITWQFIRHNNMGSHYKVPYNVRCSYSVKQLVSEVRTWEKNVCWACFFKLDNVKGKSSSNSKYLGSCCQLLIRFHQTGIKLAIVKLQSFQGLPLISKKKQFKDFFTAVLQFTALNSMPVWKQWTGSGFYWAVRKQWKDVGLVKRKRDRPRKNWINTIRWNMNQIGMACKGITASCLISFEISVTQCVYWHDMN